MGSETNRWPRNAFHSGPSDFFSGLLGIEPERLASTDEEEAAWIEHLRRAPVPSGQRVLFTRHALASGDTATATLWLDVKRAYLELRPHLRRLYAVVPDLDRALMALAPPPRPRPSHAHQREARPRRRSASGHPLTRLLRLPINALERNPPCVTSTAARGSPG